MLVKFVCTCGKKLKIDEARAGKPIRCTLCRKQLIVPTTEEAGAKYCDKCGTRLTPDTAFCYICKKAAEGVDLTSDKRSPDMLVRFNCPCGNRMKAAEVFAGAPTRCPECRRELVIPTAQVVGHKFCKFCDVRLSPDALICPDCEAKGRYEGPVAKEAPPQGTPAESPSEPAAPPTPASAAPEPKAAVEAAPSQPQPAPAPSGLVIRFHCKCGEVLKADEKRVGETIKCTFCGLPNTVPSPEKVGHKYCAKCGKTVALTAPLCPACEAEQKGASPTITAETEMIVRFRCGCSKRLKANAAASGKTTTCPRCHRMLAIPTPEELGEKYCARCNAVLRPDATKCPKCELSRVPRIIWTWVTIGVAAAALVVAVLISSKWPSLEYGPGVNIARLRGKKPAAPVEPAPGGEAVQPQPPAEAIPKPPEPEPVKEPAPPKPPEPQAPPMGAITVNTVPGGAKVFLDDKDSGVTPPSGELSLKVPSGPHKLRVEKDGYKPEEKALTVEDGKTADLQFALAAEPKPEPPKPQPEPPKETIADVALVIKCNVAGASVRLNDRDLGYTPKDGTDLKAMVKPGEYTMGVKKTGYVSWSKKLTLGAAKEAAETVQLAPLPVEIHHEKDGASMVLVPAGEFLMGSDEGADHLKPAHKVYLSPFYIDKFEVTNEQFDQFVKQSRYRPEAKVSWERYARPGMERHPVRGVTWKDATEYAKWAGKRLPTEAEWEKAARGTLGQRYPWGNDYDRAKFHGNAELDAGPAPVGSYPEGRSPYGCEDMAGNVWEWCADWHAADYYAKSPKENPTGPSSWGRKKEKVIRGGAWDRQSIEHIKCYERAQFNPSASMETIGFRCVKDVPE